MIENNDCQFLNYYLKLHLFVKKNHSWDGSPAKCKTQHLRAESDQGNKPL